MAQAVEFTRLLGTCRDMAFSHLRPLIDRMFENADVALLDFAEKAESNMAQSLFFEAMTEVRAKQKAIEQHFYARLDQSFAEFPLNPEDVSSAVTGDAAATGTLTLIDTDAVESLVAIQNITTKLENRITERIFALKQRLSVVNGGNTIQETRIPGGPAWLGAAFRYAMQQSQLEHRIQLVFVALFDKYVLSHSDTLFDEYNELLVQANILPNLRYAVRKEPDDRPRGTRPAGEPGDAGRERATDTPAPEKHQSPSELGDEIFGRICELIAGRQRGATPGNGGHDVTPTPGSRAVEGDGGMNATDDGAPAAGGDPLVGVINHLQHEVQVDEPGTRGDHIIQNIEVDQCFVERLRAVLASEREQIYKGVDRRKISGADTNIIELVGMLFEYMLEEENLPDIVKALLSRLHTPLLKVAVMDRRFFTQRKHPARKLLDDMTAAGMRWVDERFPERGILPKMRELVERVLRDFNDDVALFHEIHSQFEQAVRDLDTRASRVEERTNEAARGQEKLQAARARTREEIVALTDGRPIAPAAVDFLQCVLADRLTFILLRSDQGDKNEQWHSITALTRRVIDSVIPPADATQRQLRRQELAALQQAVRKATDTVHRNDKEKLLDALFQAQQAVLDSTGANGAMNATPITPPLAAEEHAASPDKPSSAQQAMLDKLANVPFGTWFEFSETGKTAQRAKLSWRSTVTQKFMFVDQMGVKAAIISIQELADAMSQGSVRIVSHNKKPFVDRALSAIHRMLDHAA
ncbi:MAG: DUF1631 domain-containing protein [Burkholderiales bacterium]|jgi:hypothetical protein